eukprot:CAMPEP_0204376206 /NCGR_PEP_ID=MMETSP0469-20131031/49880_1 /ASSEMBLY_ACC=CAM_ASM_000384 /TAXON_ID=2969 /ORGANISM="Oxyrrhis marina" /LENGTH=286 /DNA_ID=CAMNT_0051367037 /DNA_START=81 /DNA_END=941 /DNA_ORIENTATION=-
MSALNLGVRRKGNLSMAVVPPQPGVPCYRSPQALQGRYRAPDDLWSAGVTMHLMLMGYPPFMELTSKGILRQVKAGRLDESVRSLPGAALGLLERLLQTNPLTRCTAAEAVNHPWFEIVGRSSTHRLDSDFQLNMNRFGGCSKLTKIAMQAAARIEDDSAQARRLRKIFNFIDRDASGCITAAELQRALGGTLDEARSILSGMDTDGSGSIGFTEFMAGALHGSGRTKEAFCAFDRNRDGHIDLGEVLDVMSDDVTASFVARAFHEVDSNNDGVLSEVEFEMVFGM